MSPAASRLRILLAALLGVAAGYAGSRWALTRARPTAPSTLASLAPVELAAWDWRSVSPPPVLKGDAASRALAAWRGLGSAPYAERVDALRALLAQLDVGDHAALLAGFAAEPKGDEERLRRIVFSTWVERDPAAATRWAAAGGRPRLGLAREALRAWAARAAPAAAAWACGLPAGPESYELAALALEALAEQDPAAAHALATSREDAFRVAVLGSILAPLAKADPAAALRTYGASIWEGGEGFWKLRDTIAAWAERDPRAALAWLAAQPRGQGTRLSNWIGNLAMRDDPKQLTAIAGAVAAMPELGDRAETLADLLFRWGTDKPDEALAWLRTIEDDSLRADALARFGGRYYTEHPEKSLPLTLAMPAGKRRNEAVGNLVKAWAKLNPTAALDWIGRQEDPGVRSAAVTVQAALLADIARDEPATAVAEWERLTDPRARSAALGEIVDAWGKKDPAAALQWAQAQGESGTDMIQGDLIHAWARRDPEAALHWVEGLVAKIEGSGNTNHARFYADQAIDALGGTWRDRSPRAETAALYEKIRDPDLRTRALSKHVSEWLLKDRDGARAWLERTPALTPEQAAKLLEAGR